MAQKYGKINGSKIWENYGLKIWENYGLKIWEN